MSYREVKVEQFGGLDLDRDPGDVGWSGAIDLLDVDIDRQGYLRERDRFSSLVANSSLTDPSVVGAGGTYWIVSTSGSVRLYSDGSAVAAATAAPCQFFNSTVVPFGTPTTSYIYLADTTGANATRRLDTAGTLTAPAGMPTAQFLTRTATDNRLVAAFVGAGGPGVWNPHRVQFSDAGDAETWGANNYVDLDPGDNEEIQGAAVFGNSTYIFKNTKIFEFYGNSTDSSGNPVFNYRAIRNSVGPATFTAVGSDGVYFAGYSGSYLSVFRVNQGGVTEVGKPIRRVLSSLAPSTFTPGSLTLGDLTFAAGRLRMLGISGSSTYCFSYNPAIDQWTLMQLPNNTAYITGYGDGKRHLLVAATGANAAVHKLDPTNTGADSLRTPTMVYRSGFNDLGDPDIKTIREWRLQGIGSPTFKVSRDFGSLETGAAVTLGTSPATAEARRRFAHRGRQFSWQVSGAGVTVNNLVAHVRDKRAPGTHA